METRTHYMELPAEFVWLADREAVFSFGPIQHPKFFHLTEKEWDKLGQPKSIKIAIHGQ